METSKLISQAVTNPLIIVEVLSPSTALYDREGKFQAYQKIRYFQEYVLISQDKLLVEVYYKAKNTDFWKYRTYSSIEDIILLESIDVSIAMNDIYLNWEEEIN